MKYLLCDGGDGSGDGGGRIWLPPDPIPSCPGIQYPVWAYPSLRHKKLLWTLNQNIQGSVKGGSLKGVISFYSFYLFYSFDSFLATSGHLLQKKSRYMRTNTH